MVDVESVFVIAVALLSKNKLEFKTMLKGLFK